MSRVKELAGAYQRVCTRCNESRPIAGGMMLKHAGLRGRIFVCLGCVEVHAKENGVPLSGSVLLDGGQVELT
jgi:hypothetical protein